MEAETVDYREFLFETYAWSVVHVLIPLQCHLLLQNAKLTVLIICLWETFENFWPVVCNGSYCVVEKSWEAETVGNAVVGDVGQGLLGLLLAKLCLVAAGTVRWNVGMRRAYQDGLCCLWLKRLLQCAVLVPLYLLVNSVIVCGEGFSSWQFSAVDLDEGQEPVCYVRIGAMGVVLLNILLVLLVYGGCVNRTHAELRAYWQCKSKTRRRYKRRTYWRLHILWALCVLVIGSAAFYDWPALHGSKVFQSWLHALVLVVLLSYVAMLRAQHLKVLDVFTCGLYSLCTGRADAYHKNFDDAHDNAYSRALAHRTELDYRK